MSGTALGVGALAVTAALAVGFGAVGNAAVASARAGGSADSAALAGADIAAGFIPGDPCAGASAVARASGGSIESCTVEGTTVTVTVAIPVGVLSARATARAGPPP